MVVVQRSIIWSPHGDHSQFLAGGTELKLYQWVPEVIISTYCHVVSLKKNIIFVLYRPMTH